MEKLTDDDDLDEILLSENVSFEYEKQDHSDYIFSIKGAEQSTECYTLQEKLECQVKNLKEHITFALQRCEKKLTVVETNLRKHTIKDTKILICNAGIPYFKDRDYFFPSNNEDETLKETHKELQLRNLPRVSPWTPKERSTLFEAIEEEAIADMLLCPQKVKYTEWNDKMLEIEKERKRRSQKFALKNIQETIGRIHEREFNWFKISSIHFEDVHSPLDCRVMWNVYLHPSINKNCWTRSEDNKLKEITKKHKFQNWDKIAKELNTNRTAYQCFIRYNTTKRICKMRNCVWKNEEDERLLKLVQVYKIGDFIPWGQIASWMRNRTKQQIYFRWTYSLAPYLIKGRFSKSEDSILRDAIVKYGTNFRKISAALMPSRSTVQLHDRYQTLTTNQIKDWNVWTFTEDEKLLKLFKCYGPNWSKIAKAFLYKTRTQLRHRHAALQRYIKRGSFIFDLHRNRSRDKTETGRENEEEESYQIFLDSANRPLNKDYSSDIDVELIEYFHVKHALEKPKYERKLYNTEELRRDTRNLYNILQLLNAKLCIPNTTNDLKLDERNKQLLYSLREYTNAKTDKKKYFEIIDKCCSRMFGAGCATEGNSNFVPPPPFSSQIKLKKSKKTQCIDYNLNTENALLVEKPMNFDTPDFVISHIGGNEQELQFQKISRLFEFNTSKDQQPPNKQNLYIIPIDILRQKQQSNSNSNDENNVNDNALLKVESIVCSKSTVAGPSSESRKNEQRKTNITLFGKAQNCLLPVSSTEETTEEKNIPTLEATYATLQCLKSLTYLKQLNKSYTDLDQFPTTSEKFRESSNLLEARLEQLLKYPIALSKTALPKVYAMDTFSYDDVTLKRKNSNALKTLENHKIKKIRSFNKSNKNSK